MTDSIPDSHGAIKDEIIKALEKLGASPGLLAIVGSWKDTLPDEEILALLRRWNEKGELWH